MDIAESSVNNEILKQLMIMNKGMESWKKESIRHDHDNIRSLQTVSKTLSDEPRVSRPISRDVVDENDSGKESTSRRFIKFSSDYFLKTLFNENSPLGSFLIEKGNDRVDKRLKKGSWGGLGGSYSDASTGNDAQAAYNQEQQSAHQSDLLEQIASNTGSTSEQIAGESDGFGEWAGIQKEYNEIERKRREAETSKIVETFKKSDANRSKYDKWTKNYLYGKYQKSLTATEQEYSDYVGATEWQQEIANQNLLFEEQKIDILSMLLQKLTGISYNSEAQTESLAAQQIRARMEEKRTWAQANVLEAMWMEQKKARTGSINSSAWQTIKASFAGFGKDIVKTVAKPVQLMASPIKSLKNYFSGKKDQEVEVISPQKFIETGKASSISAATGGASYWQEEVEEEKVKAEKRKVELLEQILGVLKDTKDVSAKNKAPEKESAIWTGVKTAMGTAIGGALLRWLGGGRGLRGFFLGRSWIALQSFFRKTLPSFFGFGKRGLAGLFGGIFSKIPGISSLGKGASLLGGKGIAGLIAKLGPIGKVLGGVGKLFGRFSPLTLIFGAFDAITSWGDSMRISGGTDWWSKVKSSLAGVASGIFTLGLVDPKTIYDFFGGIKDTVINAITQPLNWIKTATLDAVDGIKTTIKSWAEALYNSFKENVFDPQIILDIGIAIKEKIMGILSYPLQMAADWYNGVSGWLREKLGLPGGGKPINNLTFHAPTDQYKAPPREVGKSYFDAPVSYGIPGMDNPLSQPGPNSGMTKSEIPTGSEATVQQLNSILGGKFAGKGQAFVDAARKYGLNPSFLAAIAMQETGNGTSRAVNEDNNPGGMMDPKTNWSKLIKYSNIESGIDSMAKNLKKNYLDKGLTSVSQVQAKYSPVGAANDPRGLNKYWAGGVSKFMGQMGTSNMNLGSSAGFSSGGVSSAAGFEPTGASSSMGMSIAEAAKSSAGTMQSIGKCYRGVKKALARVGLANLSGASAYMAAEQLSKNNAFTEVDVSPAEKLTKLPAGAVVVWEATKTKPHGHVSIALGDGREASDHIQRQMTKRPDNARYRVFMPVDYQYKQDMKTTGAESAGVTEAIPDATIAQNIQTSPVSASVSSGYGFSSGLSSPLGGIPSSGTSSSSASISAGSPVSAEINKVGIEQERQKQRQMQIAQTQQPVNVVNNSNTTVALNSDMSTMSDDPFLQKFMNTTPVNP